MNDDTIRKRLDDSYDPSAEDGLKQMLRDFYNWRMLSVILIFWTTGIALAAMAVWCAVKFFDAADTKDQIMYAAGFVVPAIWLGQLKVFAWLTIHRNSIKREIKRLELRIAQLDGKR